MTCADCVFVLKKRAEHCTVSEVAASVVHMQSCESCDSVRKVAIAGCDPAFHFASEKQTRNMLRRMQKFFAEDPEAPDYDGGNC